MNAKYTVAAMLLASASAMAAPEMSRNSSLIEPTVMEAPASTVAHDSMSKDGSLKSVGEKLERALEEQLSEDVIQEIPVIELFDEEGSFADAWPVPKGDKVASTY